MTCKFYIPLFLLTFLFAYPASASAQNWVLTWSDEFNGPANAPPDPAKWTYDIGANGWGNHELESYTSRTQNAYQDGNGNLVVAALQENYTGSDGIQANYTSARLKTQGLFNQRFGRFEARIKLPFGQGIWPAFWMLGENIGQVGWPTCGEVDVMENIGSQPSTNVGSLHGPGPGGEASVSVPYTLAGGAKLSDDFHTFSIEWSPGVVKFLVDGNVYATDTPSSLPSGSGWVWDHPFFIILNVAVGGDYPGSPNKTTVFPQTMLVDYVRVYTDASANYNPVITNATAEGKNLAITGNNFDSGSILTVNGVDQPTIHDSQNPITSLIGKKSVKRMPRGKAVTLQVRNSDGSLSNQVSFTR